MSFVCLGLGIFDGCFLGKAWKENMDEWMLGNTGDIGDVGPILFKCWF